MKRLMIAMTLAGASLLATGSEAQVGDLLDPVDNNAGKPARGAKKSAASKPALPTPGGSVPGSSGPGSVSASTGNLETTINAQLLEAARKNQCNFKGDSDKLGPDCEAKAQNLAEAIRTARAQLVEARVASFKFEVTGHTDTLGNPAANKAMSEKRAAAIVKQLVAKGVPSGEISAVGMGSEQPLIKPDNTPAKQALNRRYELRVRL
jgi:outer membrane protein OmpA-like peptidoglycan-associated protein